MKSIGSPLISCERPAKIMRQEAISQWGCLPSELFIEIFENMKDTKYHVRMTLATLCLVSRHWARCGSDLRVRLTNLVKLTMNELFGQNQLGVECFIEKYGHNLTAISVSRSQGVVQSLPCNKLIHLQSLTLNYPTTFDVQELRHLTQLTELNLHARKGSYENALAIDLATHVIDSIVDMTSLKKLDVRWPDSFLEEHIISLTKLVNLQSFNTELILPDIQLHCLAMFTQLTGLNLAVSEGSTTADYTPLSSLTNLSKLEFTCNSKVTPQFQFIKNLINLEELVINGIEDATNFLQPFSSLEKLLTLEFTECNLDGNELQFFIASTQLQDLTIWRCTEIELEHLARLTSLASLDVHSVREADVPFLSALTNLERLCLSEIYDDDFGFLDNLVCLADLTLDNCTLPFEAFEALAQFNTLSYLDLCHCDYDESFIESLGALAKLEEIQFRDCMLTDVTFSRLPLFTALRRLTLNCVEINSSAQPCTAYLALLTSLESLSIDQATFSAEEVLQLTSLQRLNFLAVYTNKKETELQSIFSYVEKLYVGSREPS